MEHVLNLWLKKINLSHEKYFTVESNEQVNDVNENIQIFIIISRRKIQIIFFIQLNHFNFYEGDKNLFKIYRNKEKKKKTGLKTILRTEKISKMSLFEITFFIFFLSSFIMYLEKNLTINFKLSNRISVFISNSKLQSIFIRSLTHT